MGVKFILRVDDVGQDLDQSKSDKQLSRFRKWWSVGKWEGVPIYLGVVPAFCGEWERGWLSDLLPSSHIALHGWDHAHAMLREPDIRKASDVFPTSQVVIPPYNLYDGETVEGIAKVLGPQSTLLGGFDGDHHRYGCLPVRVPLRMGDVLHVSANPKYYARCYQLVNTVEHTIDRVESEKMIQVVLHHRWDVEFLEGVRELREVIGPHLIRIEDIPA